MEFRRKAFSRQLRGYNRAEVNQYLREISNHYDSVVARLKSVTLKYHSAEHQLHRYDKLEGTIRQSILDSQEEADKIKAQSRDQANTMMDKVKSDCTSRLSQASAKADKLVNDALKRSGQISKGAMTLCTNIRHFRHQIIVLLKSQLTFTKSAQWDHIFALNKSYLKQTDAHDKQNVQPKDTSAKYKEHVDHKRHLIEIMYPDGHIKEVKKI